MFGSKGFLTPLIPDCYVICTPAIFKNMSKQPFFSKNGCLLMFFVGQEIKNPLASSFASCFLNF